MLAELLLPTDDPLVRKDEHGHLYVERICDGCGNPAWIRQREDGRGRFCSLSCASRSQGHGENHPRWKGDAVTYSGQHQRNSRIKGTATSCYNRELGLRDCTSTTYQWSQLHGSDGLDPLDFISLCVSCHHRYDYKGGNAVPRPHIQGTRHPFARLTEEIVAECRKRHANGDGESQRALAREFKVSPMVMNRAIRNWGRPNG